MKPSKRFGWLVALPALAAFMLLINTNSAFADKHKLNSAYLIIGIALALFAIWQLIIVIKGAGGGSSSGVGSR